jgi:hypothetical protein
MLNSVTGCQSHSPAPPGQEGVAKLLAILGEPDFVLASELELIARKG